MKRLIGPIFIFTLIADVSLCLANTETNQSGRARVYPGGVDEEDLKVQTQVEAPVRKYHPKAIYNKQLGSFEAVEENSQQNSEE